MMDTFDIPNHGRYKAVLTIECDPATQEARLLADQDMDGPELEHHLVFALAEMLLVYEGMTECEAREIITADLDTAFQMIRSLPPGRKGGEEPCDDDDKWFPQDEEAKNDKA